MIKSIPTEYSGAMFRSRLEATWAAFFDMAGWRWTYEPMDMDKWTPDFLLTFDEPLRRDFYVEVKPVSPDTFGHSMDKSPFAKAFAHWEEVHVLCLGNGPGYWSPIYGIGALLDCPEGRSADWDGMNAMLCVPGAEMIWRKAQAKTQWRPERKRAAISEFAK